MDITNLTIQELKALGYDELVKLEQAQVNLRLINEQIAIKMESEVK